jgi:membrane protein YqaA with SNARE-associated domain
VHNGTAAPLLGILSFLESFLIAIPVDPFLVAMVLADKSRWIRIAALATVSSTIGAAVGYVIGFFAFDLVGKWLLAAIGGSGLLTKIIALFSDHAIILTFAAALTPIPNGPVVVAAGFVGTNFFWFLVAWTVARTLRFFGVAYIVYAFGTDTLSWTERVFNISTVLLVLCGVGWFVYVASGI